MNPKTQFPHHTIRFRNETECVRLWMIKLCYGLMINFFFSANTHDQTEYQRQNDWHKIPSNMAFLLSLPLFSFWCWVIKIHNHFCVEEFYALSLLNSKCVNYDNDWWVAGVGTCSIWNRKKMHHLNIQSWILSSQYGTFENLLMCKRFSHVKRGNIRLMNSYF